jgi:hypothetical protein
VQAPLLPQQLERWQGYSWITPVLLLLPPRRPVAAAPACVLPLCLKPEQGDADLERCRAAAR